MMVLQRESDAMLRRFERNQVVAGVVMALAAAAARRWDVAGGVIGGALLVAVGYGGIKAAVTLMTAVASGSGKAGEERPRGLRRRAWTLVKFVSRYALLVLAAYVMLVRLRLNPVGVMLGASTPVVSAAVEAVSIVRRASRAGHSR